MGYELVKKAGIRPSATLQILDRVKELERAGEDVISLSAGEPDYVTPEHIRAYGKQALDEGYTFYPDAAGLLELRQAIADKLRHDNTIDADPASQIVVTVGGKEAIFSAMMATIGPGDEVVVPDPSWVSYVPCVELAGGKPVSLPLSESDGFRISPDRLEKAVNKKTKMLIINSPNNPTGSVMSKSDLEAVAELARRRRFLVLSDEIYERIVFDGERHFSITSFPGMEELAITVNGFSKTMAMTGWRLGYVVASRGITRRLVSVHGHLVTGPCTFAQRAAAFALRDERTEKIVRDMVEEYQLRRDIVMRELAKIDEISCFSPRGTFYAFPNIASIGLRSQEFSMRLLDRSKVAVIPGDSFGEHGEGFIRLSFATAREKLKIALERIRDAIPEFKKTRQK